MFYEVILLWKLHVGRPSRFVSKYCSFMTIWRLGGDLRASNLGSFKCWLNKKVQQGHKLQVK